MMYDVATGVSLDTLHRLRVCSGGERVAGYYRFLKAYCSPPRKAREVLHVGSRQCDGITPSRNPSGDLEKFDAPGSLILSGIGYMITHVYHGRSFNGGQGRHESM